MNHENRRIWWRVDCIDHLQVFARRRLAMYREGFTACMARKSAARMSHHVFRVLRCDAVLANLTFHIFQLNSYFKRKEYILYSAVFKWNGKARPSRPYASNTDW